MFCRQWNSFVATGGIGYDVPITGDGELILRPIFNFTLGYMATDARLTQTLAKHSCPDLDIEIVENAKMTAYGLAASPMLDWEHYARGL